MARTRRKHSYRRSRKWNPTDGELVRKWRSSKWYNPDAAPAAVAGPAKTNPRHRRGRKSRAHAKRGYRGHKRKSRYARTTRHAKTSYKKRSYRGKTKRYGRSARGHSKTRSYGKVRARRVRVIVKVNPRGGRSKSRRSHGKSRRNPAQFPAPFFSAMANPGRRGRKARRNSPIKRKDARALKRVLRSHHYSCR